jgi:hypothetical protein
MFDLLDYFGLAIVHLRVSRAGYRNTITIWGICDCGNCRVNSLTLCAGAQITKTTILPFKLRLLEG